MTKKMTKKPAKKATKATKAKKSAKRKARRTVFPRGTDLAIIYKGGLDHDRDRAIYAIVDPYGTGSGFSFDNGERDICATIPDEKLEGVVAALKELPDLTIKKQVIEWVVL